MASGQAGDDVDIKLLRASADLLTSVSNLLNQILWKKDAGGKQLKVHRFAREKDVLSVIARIDSFQEDPQLLDLHLKEYLPSLVDAYLQCIKHPDNESPRSGVISIGQAICKVLYTFCKVRGEKVVLSFLNNEPKYLESLLTNLENGSIVHQDPEGYTCPQPSSWEERYILLLWLSHQMLAPFDLASISSPPQPGSRTDDIESGLRADLPSITQRLLPLGIQALEATARERIAAAKMLARICLRPDMRKIGLLDSFLQWTFKQLKASVDSAATIHKSLGLLEVISRFVASASVTEIEHHFPTVFNICQIVNTDESFAGLRSSAIARKLIIRIFKSTILHSLQTTNTGFDASAALEEVIGHLLDSMGDGDAPVRLAASKALSVITLQLPKSLAEQIVEAVIGSLNEDVLRDDGLVRLNSVNPLRWHGLTLTLSHLLFRQAISNQQLPEVLSALLMALNFEQRSATGSSVGANVRDAANFGIWSLSRRYRTQELLKVDISTFADSQTFKKGISVIQMLAIELLQSACFDPAGNIRRGSSAALQELIGRHPDHITEGIALVQTVDYQAVGLRNRAMTQVSVAAAKLHKMYWTAAVEAALGWRGLGAVDAISRSCAGTTIGLLVLGQPVEETRDLGSRLVDKLETLPFRAVEERHGQLEAISALLKSLDTRLKQKRNDDKANNGGMQGVAKVFFELSATRCLSTPDKAFTLAAYRPELTANAYCNVIAALSELALQMKSTGSEVDFPTEQYTQLLELCVKREEDSVFDKIPLAANRLSQLLTTSDRSHLVQAWLTALGPNTSAGNRKNGYALALGSIYTTTDDVSLRLAIVQTLNARCGAQLSIEARVLALRGLGLIVASGQDGFDHSAPAIDILVEGVLVGLNDYTINERGDVGSLARLEALDVVDSLWKTQIALGESTNKSIVASVLRLSLERLDKVRVRAAHCLAAGKPEFADLRYIGDDVTQDFSTYDYFHTALRFLDSTSPDWVVRAMVEGYISSAGLGSETTVQAARSALCDVLTQDRNHSQKLVLFATTLVAILRDSFGSDRVLIPLLETLAHLLNIRILQQVNTLSTHEDAPAAQSAAFKWSSLFTLVQKSQFKSSVVPKLMLALDVYRGLAAVPSIRQDVLKKIASMLLHPFPNVRIHAAECLFVVSREGTKEKLEMVDWSRPTKELKGVVTEISKGVA